MDLKACYEPKNSGSNNNANISSKFLMFHTQQFVNVFQYVPLLRCDIFCIWKDASSLAQNFISGSLKRERKANTRIDSIFVSIFGCYSFKEVKINRASCAIDGIKSSVIPT